METLFSILVCPLLIHRQKLNNFLPRYFVLERDFRGTELFVSNTFHFGCREWEPKQRERLFTGKRGAVEFDDCCLFLSITLWAGAVLKMNYCHDPSSPWSHKHRREKYKTSYHTSWILIYMVCNLICANKKNNMKHVMTITAVELKCLPSSNKRNNL